MIILWALGASFLATAVFVAATALAARAVGLVPEVIACGAGPAPLSLTVKGTTIRFGLLVFSGSIRVRDDVGAALDGRFDFPEANPKSAVERLPLWKQLVFTLTGVAALLAVAVLLMGPAALTLSLSAVKTLALFALSPLDNDTLLADAFTALAAQPPGGRIAAVFAVYAGINLAPIALFPGGAAIMAVLGRLAGLSLNTGIGRAYFLGSLLVMAWIILMLGIQLVVLVQKTGLFHGGIA